MKLAFLAPKYKAYSESWLWRDVQLLEDVIGYIGTLNSGKTDTNNSVPIINLSALSVTQKLTRRLFNLSIPTELLLEKNIAENNARYNVDCLLINFLSFAYQIKNIVRSHKNVFIHCHGFDVTWDIRDYATPGKKRYNDDYFNFVKQIANKVKFIANSEETKRRLLLLAVPEESIFVKYFGVPLPLLPIRVAKDESIIRILFTGRFVDCKGPDIVIKAFEVLCRDREDVELIMIGDGPLFISCQLIRERTAIKDKIHLIGAQSYEVVSDYMQKCDIFTAHNMQGVLTKQIEAFGVSLLEAMSYCLPIVTGSSGGPLEIIENGSSGYLVTPGDIEEHAQRLLQLCNDRNLRRRMGIRGREIVEERFTLKKEKERFLEVLASGNYT